MAILYHRRAGMLKLHGFSETMSFQLCWLLRGNRVYARNASRKGKLRREGKTEPPPALDKPKKETAASRHSRQNRAKEMFGGSEPSPKNTKSPKNKKSAKNNGGVASSSKRTPNGAVVPDSAVPVNAVSKKSRERHTKKSADAKRHTRAANKLGQLADAAVGDNPEGENPEADLSSWETDEDDEIDDEEMILS
jgi:hypothetical protein